ncbi:MAG: hypothetical protein WCK01_04715 [Candidatus Uhrbacteria bacterium]
MPKQKPTLDDVIEKIDDLASAVHGLSSHIDNQLGDMRSEMATKNELHELEDRIVTEIDRFVVLHQTLDVELVSLRRRCERIETHVGMS